MAKEDVIITDGSLDFSGGINSIKVTTIQSAQNPHGLARNELAWLDNATVRDGGITQRPGWQPHKVIHDGSGVFQGGFMYQPLNGDPYLVAQISGHIYRITLDNNVIDDLTANSPTNHPQFNPVNAAQQAYFVQAEEFLVIQAGDGTTLPFIWDGNVLRRSKGITNPAVAPGTPGVNEIPSATTMDYYMGRLWYAQGRQYSAGDIVGGNSGTAQYNFRNSVLNVTENPLVLGGDGFTIPSQDGTTIRALRHAAAIDVSLGQGRLFIFTRNAVYALQVPVSRNSWIGATNDNQPLQTIVQLYNGATSDRSVVSFNGDLYYQSLEPGIRSLLEAVRYFQQPGNKQISANETRILQFNDRALLHVASGMQFQNRVWQTALPITTPQGIVHQAIVPLDLIPISVFKEDHQPNWEGMYEGLDIFQMWSVDFGGLERAFALIRNRVTSATELWEFTLGKTENGDGRVTWVIEFPAFTWGKEFELKKLIGAEIWADRLSGTVNFQLEYRPDGAACWVPWHTWKKCSQRTTAEDCANPASYPITTCLESYVSTMTMPMPPDNCAVPMGRPSNQGYQFQPRLVIHGFCRIRGLMLHAEPLGRKLYENITC
jgi:hypothetical protein